jgi:hypothetical protein
MVVSSAASAGQALAVAASLPQACRAIQGHQGDLAVGGLGVLLIGSKMSAGIWPGRRPRTGVC